MAKPIIKANLKGSDKIELKYNNREVDMTLSDFKLYLDEVLEPTNAVLTSSEPLRYKALLSQNAPVASTNNDTMVAGQIWELSGAAHPSDYGTIDTFELMSGTLYAGGSKYRVSIDTPFTLSASAIEYDGSPYIVSTDANGDFNPFVDTTLSSTSFTAGQYIINTAFIPGKTSVFVGGRNYENINLQAGSVIGAYMSSFGNKVVLTSRDSMDSTITDQFYYTPIEIEVYP